MFDIIPNILAELQAPGASVLLLLQKYHDEGEHQELWQNHVTMYQAFGRRLISAGHPTQAFELVREGLNHHPADRLLLYLRSLALSRGGNITKAAEYVEELLRAADLDVKLRTDALSLAGSLRKHKYLRSRTPAPEARAAAELYDKAYQLSGDSFPGINAATMSLLADQPERARELAGEVVTKVAAELRQPGRSSDYWLLATLGEAHLVLDHTDQSASWYQEAVKHAGNQRGDVASMRRNLVLLQKKIEVPEVIWDIFRIGTVVVFTGHLLDHPDRLARTGLGPRFPDHEGLVQLVRQAIRKELEKLKATVGFSSAGCGGDLLFAESMVERGAETHLVLPFDRGDFGTTSVDYGRPELAAWRQRFDVGIKQAERARLLHYATTEKYLGDDVLFGFANTVIRGLAVNRAEQLGAGVHALALLDPAAPAVPGGTRAFVEEWQRSGHPVAIIDLAQLRTQAGIISTAPANPGQIGQTTDTPTRRQVKAMIFADVKNFSKLSEEQAPSFFQTFLSLVAHVIEQLYARPAFQNTWGDGLYLVFDDVVSCADFALGLLNKVEETDWTRLGLPADTTVRMGIHAGPVYTANDPIIRRINYFGSHVNRAARIEPVTTPGCAFTSEQYAATLAVAPGHDFVCEYLGLMPLAKEFGHCPLYRLGRR